MDYLAIVLAIASAVAGFLASDSPERKHGRVGTVGVAVALLSLALICQFTGLTQHSWVNNH